MGPDDLILPSKVELKKRDDRALGRCLKLCACCSLIGVFFAPIFGLLAISSGCDAETRSLDASFDAMNVKLISLIKDRGDVTVEVMPSPSLPAVLNMSANTYGMGAVRSDQIRVKAQHFARTKEALAEMKFSAKQTGGCRRLPLSEMIVILQVFGRDTSQFGFDQAVSSLDQLLRNPPRYTVNQDLIVDLTCDVPRRECVKCDSDLVLSILSW